MQSTQPTLSIIIVSYRTREPLRRCLASIQQHKGELPVEVIVVDNDSRDGTPEMVRQEMPEAVLIEPGCNTWFTGGNNLGIKVAKGKYILILNPDTVFQANTLQNMVQYLDTHPGVGGISCQMRYLNGTTLQLTGSEIPTYIDLLLGYTVLGVVLSFWRNRRRAKMWYTGWDRQSTRAVGVLPDSCLMSPRTLLQKLNGFDEQLKLYFTEDDICKRIQQNGFECHFVADAILLHEEHASTSQFQRLTTKVYFDDLLMYSRKYYGAVATIFLQIMIFPLRQAMDIVQRLRNRLKKQQEKR